MIAWHQSVWPWVEPVTWRFQHRSPIVLLSNNWAIDWVWLSYLLCTPRVNNHPVLRENTPASDGVWVKPGSCSSAVPAALGQFSLKIKEAELRIEKISRKMQEDLVNNIIFIYQLIYLICRYSLSYQTIYHPVIKSLMQAGTDITESNTFTGRIIIIDTWE